MIIDVKDTILLEGNKEYGVVSKVNYKNQTYYFLVNIDEVEDIMYCYLENNELVEVDDKELFTNLLVEFSKVLPNEFNFYEE